MGGIQCRWTFWAVSKVGGIFWAVSKVGGISSAVSGNYNYGENFSAVLQHGGTLLAVCGISVFGGNNIGGRRYLHITAVNRGISGAAHQSGNFTAGKSPTFNPAFFPLHAKAQPPSCPLPTQDQSSQILHFFAYHGQGEHLHHDLLQHAGRDIPSGEACHPHERRTALLLPREASVQHRQSLA